MKTEDENVSHKGSMLHGKCLCGAVQISLAAPASEVHICHCTMCQQWGGSALFTLPGVSEDGFALTGEGDVQRYAASAWGERAFCGVCGSNLWYRFIPTGKYSLVAGLFALPDDFAVSEEIFVDEECHWLRIDNSGTRQTGPEVIAEAKAAGFSLG